MTSPDLTPATGSVLDADPAAVDRQPAGLRGRIGELVFAVLVLALGVFALVGVFSIRVPAGARVGPTVFPMVVAALLLAAGVALVVKVLRGDLGEAEESEDLDTSQSTDWLTLGKIAVLVLAHMFLVPIIGWAFAAAILFGGVAWSLGAKRWWSALLIGLAVGLVVQIVFGELLGLSLPLGPALGWLGDLI